MIRNTSETHQKPDNLKHNPQKYQKPYLLDIYPKSAQTPHILGQEHKQIGDLTFWDIHEQAATRPQILQHTPSKISETSHPCSHTLSAHRVCTQIRDSHHQTHTHRHCGLHGVWTPRMCMDYQIDTSQPRTLFISCRCCNKSQQS